MSKDIPISDSVTNKVSQDIYQQAADALMTSFIKKLEDIIKELELNDGDFTRLKSETKSKLGNIEAALPKPLKDRVSKKIKTPEKEHDRSVAQLEAKKLSETEKRHKRREASQAAMDFFKIFLPDIWVQIIQDNTLKSKRAEEAKLIKEAHDSKSENTAIAKAKDSSPPDNKSAEEKAAHEQSYQAAHAKLMSIYNARISNIKIAIELAGGDVTKLDPSVVVEIKSLQAILPDGQLKMLDKFLEGKSTDKEATKALNDKKEAVAKELSDIVAGTISECSIAISDRPIMRSLALTKHKTLSLEEIDYSQPRSLPNVADKTKSDFTIADMDAYRRRMSGEGN